MLYGNDGGKITRVAVFFDGGFFEKVSTFYRYGHERKARLSVDGVQAFIKQKSAECEKVDPYHCHIVESHYFRGRFSAKAAKEQNKLEDDRRFDEILMRAGIVQHYLPLDESRSRPVEKGIDVWLSLEAFDLAVHKRFDVLALIGCDGDYVPLVRKLSGIGTRVMLLCWDFRYEGKYTNGTTFSRETKTSAKLIDVSTYPIDMMRLVDGSPKGQDDIIDGLFVPQPIGGDNREAPSVTASARTGAVTTEN